MSVGVREVLKAMEETAQVIALGCFKKLSLVVILLLLYVISFFFQPAVFPSCSPSCGPNAFCQQSGNGPFCACNLGFEGDGYNCTGISAQRYLQC